MYSALLKKQNAKGFGRVTGKVATIPAPVGGWNARDALSDMKAEDAIVLDNIIPDAGRVRLRPGYVVSSSGLGADQVETLMEYSPPSGGNELFAAAGQYVYDVTTAGSVGAPEISGLTSARWQHVMMANTSGNHLCMVNGSDHYYTYNGSSWTDQNAALTGITGGAANSTELIGISVHASRLWFVQKGSMDLWYLGTQAITGAATKFPLGPLCKKGGYVMAIGTWTKDGGSGMDDLFVAVTSKGEVVVYSGTDPANASTWQLVGVFSIAEPVGRRCLIKVGGDLGVITSTGVAMLGQLIGVNVSGQRKVTITNKIARAFQDAYGLSGTNFGWQIAEFPKQNIVIVNVPSQEGELIFQFVINVETGAWCRFTGINANCWSLMGDRMFLGGTDGKVYEFGSSDSDNGTPISCSIQMAYNRCGTNAVKVFRGVRPLILASDGFAPGIEIKTDYDVAPITATPTPSFSSSGALWDVADWDVADWGAAGSPNSRWRTVFGQGTSVSVCLVGSSADVVFEFNQIDIMFEQGSFI